jgi:hypothetical protein
MVGELWEEGATEFIDDDLDDELDLEDDDVEADNDVETWCTIRRYLPLEPDAGE